MARHRALALRRTGLYLHCRYALEPAMRVRVQKWGNSLAIRIPKPFAVEAGGGPGGVGRARGDVVGVTLTPQTGHEQAGRRPALVVSPQAYNGKVGLAVFCPITSQVKGYPFEVAVPPGLKVAGAILSDQGRSLDWRARAG